MSTKSTVTYTGLTYTELLATIPWIALLPNSMVRECEYRPRTTGKGARCKVNALLLYIDLDGSTHSFCHHHLHDARFDEHNPSIDPNEVARIQRLSRRYTIERSGRVS